MLTDVESDFVAQGVSVKIFNAKTSINKEKL